MGSVGRTKWHWMAPKGGDHHGDSRRKKAAPCLGEFRMTLTGVPINHACAHLNLTGYC